MVINFRMNSCFLIVIIIIVLVVGGGGWNPTELDRLSKEVAPSEAFINGGAGALLLQFYLSITIGSHGQGLVNG